LSALGGKQSREKIVIANEVKQSREKKVFSVLFLEKSTKKSRSFENFSTAHGKN
jgi:aspartate carbamoyltransferase catalytic subunit